LISSSDSGWSCAPLEPFSSSFRSL
jgi:hypothetical protein